MDSTEYRYKVNYSYARPSFHYTKKDADRYARKIARKALVQSRVTRLSDGELVSVFRPEWNATRKLYRVEKAR